MKNCHSKLVAILFSLTLLACSNASIMEDKFKGKQFNPNAFKKINNVGHHIWKLEDFDIDYSYSIDTESKTMTLAGTAKYNVPYEEREFRSEMVLQEFRHFEILLVFADSSGEVLAVKSYYVYPKGFLVDPFKFKATVPYESNYDLVYFSYGYSSRSN